MRVRRTSLTAAVGITVLLTWPGSPAQAVGPIAACSLVGDTISLELTAGGYDELTFANVNDHVEVSDESGTYACSPATSAAATIFATSPGPTAHTWIVDLTTPFTSAQPNTGLARLVLGSQPGDPVTLYYPASTPQTWSYSAFLSSNGSLHEMDLDGAFSSDLAFGKETGLLTLITGSGNDSVDLASGVAGAYNEAGGTAIVTGAGADQVTGSDGVDTIAPGTGNDVANGGNAGDTFIDDAGADVYRGYLPGQPYDGWSDQFTLGTDGEPDQVNPEFGDFDALTYDTGVGVHVSINDGADDGAPGEGDSINGVMAVTTGSGNDQVNPNGLWSITTMDGDDRIDVDDFSLSGLWDLGSGADDLLDFSLVTSNVDGTMTGGNGSFTWGGDSAPAIGVEHVIGSAGSDTFGVGCDCLVQPGPGNDAVDLRADGAHYLALDGADGADVVTAAEGFRTIADYSLRSSGVSLTEDGDANDGAPGEGDLIGQAVTDLYGGGGNDTLVGSVVDNLIRGGGGSDTISGRGGNDRLQGANGGDIISGGSGNDRLLGFGGNDKLSGGEGDDLLQGDDLFGASGNDTLDGGTGDDDEYGYGGNDTFLEGTAANGGDLLVGGLGTDLASYSLRAAALKLTLNGRYDDGAAGEGDRIGNDVENLTGGKGADLLVGNALANLLTGGLGKDTLKGLAGNDIFQTLDKLVDVLDGGTGTDKAHRDTTDKVTSVEQKF
jgi:Ca2+-binding RTX toxin-like protein